MISLKFKYMYIYFTYICMYYTFYSPKVLIHFKLTSASIFYSVFCKVSTLLCSNPSFPTQCIFPLWINRSHLQLIQHMMSHSPGTIFLCMCLSPQTYWLYFFLIGVDMDEKAIWPFGGWFSLGTSLQDTSVVLIWCLGLLFLFLILLCPHSSLSHNCLLVLSFV